MTWGSAFETNMAIRRAGRSPPAGSLDKPDLPEHLAFVWESFWDLSTERDISMSVGPIPHSAIRAYAAEYDVCGDFYEHFRKLIRTMDDAFVKKMSPKPANAPGPGVRDTVKMTDAAGVSNLLKRLAKPDPPAE